MGIYSPREQQTYIQPPSIIRWNTEESEHPKPLALSDLHASLLPSLSRRREYSRSRSSPLPHSPALSHPQVCSLPLISLSSLPEWLWQLPSALPAGARNVKKLWKILQENAEMKILNNQERKEIKEIKEAARGEVQPLLGEESSGPFPIPAHPTPHLLPDFEPRLGKHHLMGTRGDEEGGKTSLAVPRQPPQPQLSTFPRPEEQSRVLSGACPHLAAEPGKANPVPTHEKNAPRLPSGHGVVSDPSGQTFAPKKPSHVPLDPSTPAPAGTSPFSAEPSPHLPRPQERASPRDRVPRQPSTPGRGRGAGNGEGAPGRARWGDSGRAMGIREGRGGGPRETRRGREGREGTRGGGSGRTREEQGGKQGEGPDRGGGDPAGAKGDGEGRGGPERSAGASGTGKKS